MNYCNHYAGPCPALSTKCSAHRQINIALPHKIRIQSATQILIKIQKHECRHQDFQQTFQKQNFLFVFFDYLEVVLLHFFEDEGGAAGPKAAGGGCAREEAGWESFAVLVVEARGAGQRPVERSGGRGPRARRMWSA